MMPKAALESLKETYKDEMRMPDQQFITKLKNMKRKLIHSHGETFQEINNLEILIYINTICLFLYINNSLCSLALFNKVR